MADMHLGVEDGSGCGGGREGEPLGEEHGEVVFHRARCCRSPGNVGYEHASTKAGGHVVPDRAKNAHLGEGIRRQCEVLHVNLDRGGFRGAGGKHGVGRVTGGLIGGRRTCRD